MLMRLNAYAFHEQDAVHYLMIIKREPGKRLISHHDQAAPRQVGLVGMVELVTWRESRGNAGCGFVDATVCNW